MVEDPDAASIVNAIINMAHALKMRVIAEGVETHEQCDLPAGLPLRPDARFHCSPPTAVDDIPALVRRLSS